MPPSPPIVGAIEAGGTKMVCAVGSGPGPATLARAQFPTGDDPAACLRAVTEWLSAQERSHGRLEAIGIASFGPVDLHPGSPTYGHVTTTPKRGWRNTDVVGPLRRAFPGRAVGFDTDVNGAALGEGRWGAARGLTDFVYVTVGTGIGGGAVAGGRLVHGLVHPEMGHMPMGAADGDPFPGACAIHGRCWEGLCSGPAIAARAGVPAEDLPADHPAWDLTMRAMGQALATVTCVLSPQRIILGGSVRRAGGLGEAAFLAGVRNHLRQALAGYIHAPTLAEGAIDGYLVPPELGDAAGVCGAMALAQEAIGHMQPAR
jgi:fructokinase